MLVGVAQIEPRLGEAERNLETCLARLEEAAAEGCSLLVLPECASSGYMFESPEEAAPHAQAIPGSFSEALTEACIRLRTYCVAGMLEREGDLLRNTALLTGPEGILGRYRKSHLPCLGVDRFVAPGDDLGVFETPIGRIGIEICYDLRFPEVTRTLALCGAEIVAHPTNWPLAARSNADVLTRARAHENRLFLLTANRVGRERAAEFCGWSQVCDVRGDRLVAASESDEGVFLAEIDLEEARQKDLIPIPGEYEMYLFGDRRPELYGMLVREAYPIKAREGGSDGDDGREPVLRGGPRAGRGQGLEEPLGA
jgi:predicted amidohydrolase